MAACSSPRNPAGNTYSTTVTRALSSSPRSLTSSAPAPTGARTPAGVTTASATTPSVTTTSPILPRIITILPKTQTAAVSPPPSLETSNIVETPRSRRDRLGPDPVWGSGGHFGAPSSNEKPDDSAQARPDVTSP